MPKLTIQLENSISCTHAALIWIVLYAADVGTAFCLRGLNGTTGAYSACRLVLSLRSPMLPDAQAAYAIGTNVGQIKHCLSGPTHPTNHTNHFELNSHESGAKLLAVQLAKPGKFKRHKSNTASSVVVNIYCIRLLLVLHLILKFQLRALVGDKQCGNRQHGIDMY